VETILTGALRRQNTFTNLRERLEEAGFADMVSVPVLVPSFVIIDLRDVTDGPWYGYAWQMRVAVVTAVAAQGPYESDTGWGPTGVVELAARVMPTVAPENLAVQVPQMAVWAGEQMKQVQLSPELRVRHQMAQAQWYLDKAAGCRQGVADRLWRDRLLDDAPASVRAEFARWVHDFGREPLILSNEYSAHERALYQLEHRRKEVVD
jgi:hypothetical protein